MGLWVFQNTNPPSKEAAFIAKLNLGTGLPADDHMDIWFVKAEDLVQVRALATSNDPLMYLPDGRRKLPTNTIKTGQDLTHMTGLQISPLPLLSQKAYRRVSKTHR